MTFLQVASILITLTALFSFINYRWIRLPTTIGVMLIAMITSLALIAIGSFEHSFRDRAAALVAGIDFENLLLHCMLAFLLFAGALHLDVNELARQWLSISVLAIVGTVASTFLVATGLHVTMGWLNISLPMIHCLLFGALISPTDPIAVLGMLKQAKAVKSLQTLLAGESLFNDGVGVVIFLVLLTLLRSQHAMSYPHIALLFIEQALGGAGLGLAAGFLAYLMLKFIDNYQVEVLVTLALCMGGYALAEAVGVSAPIAIVVAGLLIGNHGRHFAMSEKSREHLDMFWELIDEILNAFLFLLLGLQLLVIPFPHGFLLAALIAIALTLLTRLLTVGVLMAILQPYSPFAMPTVMLLTWGGLRGGLAVAMALAIPQSPYRNLLLTLTYSVVVFAVIVQGLTMPKLISLLRTPTSN